MTYNMIYELTLKHVCAEILIHLVMIVHWTAHAQLTAMLESSDSTLATMNMLSMFFISIIPFTVSLVYNWHEEFYTALLINLNLIIISLFTLLMWLYATYKKNFIYRTVSRRTIRKFNVRFIVPVVMYSLSIAVSPISNYFSLVVSMIVPFLFIVSSFGFDVMNRLYDIVALLGRIIVKKQKTINPDAMIQVEFLKSELYHARLLDRVKAISDNVFGITITLMVIKLAAPERTAPDDVVTTALAVMQDISNSTSPAPWNRWNWNQLLGEKLFVQSNLYIYLYNVIAFVVVCFHDTF